jgi:hypothetical protein
MAGIMKDHPHLRECNLVNTNTSGIPIFSQQTLKAAIAKMLDAARHYETWRRGLGVSGGVALCFGSEAAETS